MYTSYSMILFQLLKCFLSLCLFIFVTCCIFLFLFLVTFVPIPFSSVPFLSLHRQNAPWQKHYLISSLIHQLTRVAMVTLKPILQQYFSCCHSQVLLAYSQNLPALSSTSSPTMSNHICKPKYQHQQLPPSPQSRRSPIFRLQLQYMVTLEKEMRQSEASEANGGRRRRRKLSAVQCTAQTLLHVYVCVCGRERERGRDNYVCVRVCLPCTCQKKLFTLFKFRNKGNSKSNKCSLAFSSRK